MPPQAIPVRLEMPPLRAIIIEMDPDNPVVRLCVKGMECEFAGDLPARPGRF